MCLLDCVLVKVQALRWMVHQWLDVVYFLAVLARQIMPHQHKGTAVAYILSIAMAISLRWWHMMARLKAHERNHVCGAQKFDNPLRNFALNNDCEERRERFWFNKGPNILLLCPVVQ